MSEEQSAHHTKNEIIIIKRRSDGDHDAHHGGVWKIAYADFMTAMMAFFLVMWLINAANDQTKAAVASYFNPIKLVDQKPADKGIKDDGKSTKKGELSEKSKSHGTEAATGDGGQSGKEKISLAGDKTQYSEADYFKNPYSVLSDIAEETGEKANVSAAGAGGAQTSGPATGASGGKAYRDPFDPDFWTQQVQTVRGKQIQRKDIATPVAGSTASGDVEHGTGERSRQSQQAASPKAAGTADHRAKPAEAAEVAQEKAAPAGKAQAAAADQGKADPARRGPATHGRGRSGGAQEEDRRRDRRDRRQARRGDQRQAGGRRRARQHHGPRRRRHVQPRLGRAAPRHGRGHGEDRQGALRPDGARADQRLHRCAPLFGR